MNTQQYFNNLPYNLDTIFTQICQYKCFQVNLKRAILQNKPNIIRRVKLINSNWFDKWKKISCYEAIKDELDLGISIQQNYNKNKNNYLEIIKNLEISESLENNINNNSLISGFDNSLRRISINPRNNFEIISQELWESFVPPNNINNGTSIELNLEYLTKFALIINLSSLASYIIFWNINKQQLEKIILIFSDEGQKYLVMENLKQLGINNFNACYLDDLVGEDFRNNSFSFKCIKKTENIKIIQKNDIPNQIITGYNINNNFNNDFDINIPVGLNNIGQTCYMNSALQCLINISKLTNFFLTKANEIDQYNQILSHAYLDIVKNVLRKTNESKYITSYSPFEFQGIISINPLFTGASDSIDLINHFLQTIHKELNFETNENILSKYLVNNVGNNIKFQNLNLSLNNFISDNNSIITNTFYIIEKSKLICNNCKQIQYSFQMLSYIIFPLEEIRLYKKNNFGVDQPSVLIMQAFEYYRRQCPLFGENQIHCNLCGRDSNAIQCSSFYSLPEILIINLNRGHGNIYNVGIIIEEYLNLSNYAESNIYNNSNYRCIGIITHLGPSGNTGHFIAFCFVKDKNKWFKFNDSIVEPSNFQDASTLGDSYVLFYERQ